MLLALTVEEESTTQGTQADLETRNDRDVDSPVAFEGIQPYPHLF